MPGSKMAENDKKQFDKEISALVKGVREMSESFRSAVDEIRTPVQLVTWIKYRRTVG